MTKEQKDLLMKDLCSRLPYKVKAQIPDKHGGYTAIIENIDIEGYIVDSEGYLTEIEWVKPYLFPFSSMTEEQKIECFKGTPLEIDKYGGVAVKDDFYGNSLYTDLEIYLEVIDWLNKHHFDYRGLIEKSLALDATELNIY